MRLHIVCVAAVLAASSATAQDRVAHQSAENVEFKQWSLWCRADVLDDYGDIRFKRHCTAYISRPGQFDSIPIMTITDAHTGMASATAPSDCDYQPRRVAVDGKRIDTLDEAAQMEAIFAGKKLVREVWKLHWPECQHQDVTVDITGAKQAWERLLKLKAKIYDKNIAYTPK
ncbi:hypothetical protein J2857_006197 [Neorhizobium galegae]|uniref:hypothetical protein n=1 Tax=Neorhizobium galegae TaxID=399 RepID=UPI001AE590B8|nr:hypothetical protein [Neorhizobium galegae]MBP2563398.1 hypothetical protein [Neorhizobium galegae]